RVGVGGEAGVHGPGLDDGAARGGEPAEALSGVVAGGRPGRVAALADGFDAAQRAPYAGHVGEGVEGEQPALVEVGAGAEVAGVPAVEQDADVDAFAAFDPGDGADQRVLVVPELLVVHQAATSGSQSRGPARRAVSCAV